MKILLTSSEVFPFSKTGGLADMVAALAKTLAQKGHRVGLVTPLYQGIRERFPDLRAFDWRMDLPMDSGTASARVWTQEPARGLTVYFIDAPYYYDRPGVYGESWGDYGDNAARFIFLAKATVHLARYLPWQPEIVHAHDWPTGLVPLLVRHQANREGWEGAPKTCFTIHNLAYQGSFPAHTFPLTNLPWDFFRPEGAEYYGQLSFLKAALIYADALTTVSPRYAEEITTPAMGCGLHEILRARRQVLTGILNGADYEEWKTTRNPWLPHSYSARQWRGKALNKLALQKAMGLPQAVDIPVFGNIGRLAEQKGLDLLMEALPEVVAEPVQFVVLGRGQREYESALQSFAAEHPDKFAVKIGFDHGLPHLIEAGSDFYLMPSRFEPCGLNQMYSLRYGTIPIVRAVGGLDDSVTDITEQLHRANGIKFHDYSAAALVKAMRKALALYHEPLLLRHYRQNAVKADFSWGKTVAEYLNVFRQALAAG